MVVWQILFGNLACVITTISLWMHLQYKFYRLSKTQLTVGFGATVGCSIGFSMMLAVEFVPGVYFDLRTSLLMLSAVFGGPLSIAITAPMAIACRIFLGGAGVVQGSLAILIVSVIGLLIHLAVGSRQLGIKGIFALAGTAGLVSISLTALLATRVAPTAIREIGIPIALLNVFATAIISGVLIYFHRFTMERDILRAALTQAPEFHYVKNLKSEFVVTNLNVAQHNGRQRSSEMVGLTDFDITPFERAQALFAAEQDVITSGRPIIDLEERLVAETGEEYWFSTSKVVLRNRHGDTIGLAGVTRDITQQKRLEDQVQKSRNLLSQAMEEMSDGLAMFDVSGYLIFCNEQYRAAFPRSAYARQQGSHITDIVRASIRSGERQDVAADVSEEWITTAAASIHSNKDEEIQLFDGRWLSLRTRMAQDGSALVVVSDVTVMKQSEQSLRQLADHMKGLAETDGLTELSNRRTFDESIALECARSSRNGKPLSLLLIDVDHFKAYNDSYGHPAGDAALKTVSQCLLMIGKRAVDIVARYGGEEFVVLLPETNLTDAMDLAEEFRSALQELQFPHRSSRLGFLTASIGVAVLNEGEPAAGPAELIAQADEALYNAKREGRNRVHAISPNTASIYLSSTGER